MPVIPAVAAVGTFIGAHAVPLALAASGVASSVIGANAAKSAAATEAAAAQQATSVQQQMYQQTRADLAPFRQFGGTATTSLSKLLGLDTQGVTAGAPNWTAYGQANPDVQQRANELVNSGVIGPQGQWATPEDWMAFHYANTGKAEGRNLPTFTAADVANADNSRQSFLENTPGYKFARDQGILSITRQLGSMGLTGAQAKGIGRFVSGLAANDTYFPTVNAVQNAVNTGENAAAQTGSIGQGYGGNISNTIVGAGQAQAAGTVGAANAISGGAGSVANALLLNKILGAGTSTGGGKGIYQGAGGVGFDPNIPGS